MKMTINVEMTPEELRRFLGLPDLSAMQDEWIEKYREQVGGGADPAAFVNPLFASPLGSNTAAMEAFNKAFWAAFSGASNPSQRQDADEGGSESS